MPVELFELHIQQSLQKMEDLRRRAETIPAFASVVQASSEAKDYLAQQQLLQDSLIELSTSIEELRIATETIQQQNQKLFVSRQQIILERKYYQELFEYSPDICLVTSSNGSIREANHEALKLLNVPAKYLINKSLAVFIPVGQRQQYYQLLNQLKSGKVSTVTWDTEIVPREQASSSMQCKVVAIRDSQQNILNLRWRITAATQTKNTAMPEAQLSSILVDNLRNPLRNLDTQLNEIVTTAIDGRPFDPRLCNLQSDLKTILDNVEDVYILKHFRRQDLKRFLIDYTVSCNQLAQLQQDKAIAPRIKFSCQESYNGICDAFLFKKTIANLLSCITKHSSLTSKIKIKLNQQGDRIAIAISSLGERSAPRELVKILDTLCNQNSIGEVTTSNLKLAVIRHCVSLLQGEIELDTTQPEVTVIVTLPAIMNLGS
ncbi:MAG TPA: PAS domain-containing protein [Coleofasciculaceae cyanobacterium]|jgi:PAS domain S-box-containing protein